MGSTDQMLLALMVALILAVSAIALLGGASAPRYFYRGTPPSAARVDRLAVVALGPDGAIAADRHAKEMLGGEVSDIRDFANRFESERTALLSELRLLTSEGVRFEQTHRTKAGRVLSLIGAPASSGAVVHMVDDTKLRRRLLEARDEIEKVRSEVSAQSVILSALDVYALKLDQDGKPTWRSSSLSLAPKALEQTLIEARQTGGGRRTISNDDGSASDYNVQWKEMSNQSGLAAAISLANLQKAEHSLQQFVDTMSVTFAHLSMALMVFDRERRVVMFNPAAASMFDEQAVWLARQPHLREILDRMRDQRMIPKLTTSHGVMRFLSGYPPFMTRK